MGVRNSWPGDEDGDELAKLMPASVSKGVPESASGGRGSALKALQALLFSFS